MSEMPESPYYRLYSQQPPFPTADNIPPVPIGPLPLTPPPVPADTTAPLTLYGGRLTAAESARELPRRTTGWLMTAAGLLLVILGVSAVGVAGGYVGTIEASFVATMFLVAAVLWGFGSRRSRAAALRAETRRRRAYEDETEGGVTTVFYADRVEQRSPVWTQTLLLSGTLWYYEHETFLTLTDGVRAVSLRAADLTPEQAQAVYERICAVVPPERQYADGRFYATRQTPAAPPIESAPARVYEQMDGMAASESPEPSGWLPWLLAMSLITASLFASLFAVTPFFVLDYVIFLAAIFLPSSGAALLWQCATRPKTAPTPVTLTFTAVGLLSTRADGIQHFATAADVHARRTENGALLFTPSGRYRLRWTDAHSRQQLEWMLFGGR